MKEVSFEIRENGVVGLLGPNGAGKSTLMKMLSVYFFPDSGQIVVEGMKTDLHSLELRRILGYLPEHNPLYLDMYVREYLHFVGDMYGLKSLKKEVDRVLELVNFGKESGKKIGKLSKGYRQRLGIAQALIHDPKILILDEPTSGLDPNQLQEIRDVIQEIARDKIILFSTHIMQEAEAICRRFLVLNQGQLVADTPAREIGSFRHSSKIHVEFQFPVRNIEELGQEKGIEKIESLSEREFLIYTDDSSDIRPLIFAWAVKSQNPLLGLHKESSDIASLFTELTSQKHRV